MKRGWYDNNSPLEDEVSKAWKPIGEVVNVDDKLYSMMETNFRLYTMALQGRDGQLVNDIGTDLRQAFDKVLLIMGRDVFGKSPFGALYKRYSKVNEKYTIKPINEEGTGIGAKL